ncbi:MAG: 5-3 exonuclease [Pseudonocardiales bacterium]|nr:5-3 exonuclease [Pseudonocardiales bacterium]
MFQAASGRDHQHPAGPQRLTSFVIHDPYLVGVTDGRVLLAIDGNSLVHRSFHAQAHTNLRSSDGKPMWAVRGLLMQIVAAVERIGPDAVIVGFDDAGNSRRKRQWPQYKATRTEKLETLVDQLILAAEVLRELGVAVVVPPGLEADDVLASVAAYAPTVGARTVIMTSDRDAFALIDDHTRVLRIINGGVEASPLLNADRLQTMIGINPTQYRDYAALRGDPSDNLLGVRGIGPKTAAALLTALGSASAAFDDLAAGGERVTTAIGRSASAKLSDPSARAAWELNCAVMTMHTDVGLSFDLGAGPGILPFGADGVRSVFARHQLVSTTANALRVLAHDQSAPAVHPSTMTWTYSPRRDRRPEWTGPARPPKLVVPTRPKSEQLSLFD